MRPLHAAHEVAEVREALGREVASREQLGEAVQRELETLLGQELHQRALVGAAVRLARHRGEVKG